MALSAGYPEDWDAIALAVKIRAGWQCEKCGKACLAKIDVPKLKEQSRSERMRETLQAHHWDRDPSNNKPENLVAVCTGCHLWLHRGGRSNVSPGQLSLWSELAVSNVQIAETSEL